MEHLLAQLRACAEPTRLRLLALAARGSFCVTEFTEILGQSQPRLSRHLRLLCEAGLLERGREGTNVWFSLAQGAAGRLVGELLARLPDDEPLLEADRRGAARVLAERARSASAAFQHQGADWDETGALNLPAEQVEAALLALLPPRVPRLLDIGTGTGRLLELAAPRAERALGVDASRQMLALARARLARPGFAHCAVRQADMYNLPLATGSQDAVVLQMVLHYAEDPASVLREAARVLAPQGVLAVVELGAHERQELVQRLAHRWPGFAPTRLDAMLQAAGLAVAQRAHVPADPPILLLAAGHSGAAQAAQAASMTVA